MQAPLLPVALLFGVGRSKAALAHRAMVEEIVKVLKGASPRFQA